MIELRDIRKVFNQGSHQELTAVDGVSLAVDACKVTVLQGPSGSGKTTLLSLIGCMTRPTSGRILLGDREITSLPETVPDRDPAARPSVSSFSSSTWSRASPPWKT